MIDYFAILGLPTSASVEDIKKARRASYASAKNVSEKRKEEFYKRKQRVYEDWVKNGQQSAQQQAKYAAQTPYKKFEENLLAKLATGCGKLFGLIILFISFMVIFMPWMAYFGEEDIEKRISLVMVLFLSIIGVVFLVGAYKMNFEEQ